MSYTEEYLADGTAILTDDNEPNTRYIVWQDTDAEDPRDWNESAQTLIYNAPRHHGIDDTSESAAESATMRAFLRRYDETGDDTDALAFAQRFTRVWDLSERIDTATVCGYSRSDWADVVCVTTGDTEPADYIDVFRQYFAGDVYAVMLETFTECESPDDCHGDTESHWSPTTEQGIDSITLGNIYAENAEDAVRQYLEQL